MKLGVVRLRNSILDEASQSVKNKTLADGLLKKKKKKKKKQF